MQETNPVHKATGWVLDSGIQQSSGAFCAWFDLGKGRNSFEYSETTGYGITALAFLNQVKGNSRLVEKAGKAGQWLSEKAITKEGAVLARNYQEFEDANEKFSFEGGNVFAFDAGMVLNGFVDLHALTGEHQFIDTAKRIGNFLLENMFKEGKMYAIYSTKTGEIKDSEEKWSTQPGSFHAKLSIGFLKLAETARGKRFRKAATALCENALLMQKPDGRFVTNSRNKSTHLHPHCYAAEGLLFAGLKLGKQRFVDAAENAVNWALSNQAKDSGINAFFSGEWNQSQRSDVIAQVLRLALALKAIGRLASVPEEKLSGLRKRLLQFQHESGGFLYGKELDLDEKNCVNSWCTMFALQALQWYSNREAIDIAGIV